MRRLLLGALLATVVLLGFGAPTPALAHDASFSAASGDKDRDRQDRSEASQLTDELRAAASRPSKAPAVQAAVAGKAERRRALLNRLARTSPAAVLELALTHAERAALPASLRPFVEERVNVDGELQVLHIDYEDGHSAYESKLVKGGQERPIAFGAPLGQARPGDLVKSSGVALAGDPTVVTDQMVVVHAPTAIGTTGPQRTAIILVTTPGVASHPYANAENTASLFFSSTSGQSARAFYLEASYGQTTIVGGDGAEGTAADVYGPFSIAATSCGSSELRDQAFAAADPALNFSTYDRIVLSIINPSCGNGGIGTIRTQTVSTAEGTQRLSISWDFGSALGSTELNGKIGGVALHEYGHNLGVWHANALECGEVAIGSGSCASDEYGDPSDVMGSSSGYGHLNGVHKDILGWIGTRARVAASAGSYTLFPYEDSALNTKVLKVPRTRDANGTVTGYYYLEYRKPTAAWSAFAASRPDYGKGVLVHTSGATPLCTTVCSPDFSGSGGGGDSNIIDTQPASQAGTNDLRDAPLLAGESYADVGAGVSIQVTSASPTGAVVALSFTTPLRSIQTIVYPEGAGAVSGGGTFTPGQSVTLTAEPASCFLRWRENRASQLYPNPYTFTVSADRTLEAVFSESGCASPPANDTFPGPTVGGGQQAVNTSGATVQAGEPTSLACGSTTIPTGRTVWYTLSPSTTSQVTLTTVGSDFDTTLAVYTGSAVNTLTPLACNDDAMGVLTSQLQFTAQAGTSYRVQLGGYGGEGGNAVLNVTLTAQESDPRQEGPIQLSGNLTVGGGATFTVAVKNYGAVATPALYPVIDGTSGSGQPWRADQPQPSSAVLQPGQTVTFTLSQPITSAGTWSTTGVSLWNATTGAAWKALPANGQSQHVSFQVAVACSPRPPVSVQTVAMGDGRLTVTIAAGSPETGNRLLSLQFAGDARVPNPNALIDLPGIGNGRTAPTTAALSNSPASYTFYVRRQNPAQPVTLPVTVTDGCGAWQTVVGGGTGAGF